MDESQNPARWRESRLNLLLAIAAALLALWTLTELGSFLHSANDDTRDYILPWLRHILQFGPVASLEASYANYSPPYLYLLSLFSLLHGAVSNSVLIRLPNLPFILLAGLMVYDLSRFFRASRVRAALGGLLTLFLPDVVLDSYQWAQCDIIHTAILLVAFRLFLARRPAVGMGVLGVALSFKLQAIFAGPVVLGLLLAGEIPWASLLAVPVTYTLMLTPAYLAGRPVHDLLGVYGKQVGTYTKLSMNAANPYVFLVHVAKQWSDKRVAYVSDAGLLVCLIATVALVLFSRRHARLSAPITLAALFALSLLAEPYLLPKMHERYFFAGELFLVVAALGAPRLWPAAILLQVAAAMTYACFLDNVPASTAYLGFAALLTTAALALLLRFVRAAPSAVDAGSQARLAPVGVANGV